jgi:uncharacterized protein (DUF885 family)
MLPTTTTALSPAQHRDRAGALHRPTRARLTAYKIGEIRIAGDPRRKPRPIWAAKFDVRRFHDALLVDGAMPLDVLGEQIKAWTAKEKAKP